MVDIAKKLDDLQRQVQDLFDYVKSHLSSPSILPVPRLSVRLTPEQVRAARTVLGMDQQAFAEALGIRHASTISRWERIDGACRINRVYSATVVSLVRKHLVEQKEMREGATDKDITDYLDLVL